MKLGLMLDWFLRNREWIAAGLIVATGFGIGIWEFLRWICGKR